MTRRAAVFAGNYRPDQFGIGRFVPHYVDALAAAGWSVDVHAPYPYYPSWKMDRSLPRVAEEHGGRVRVHRYAPFVPRRPNALTRSLHEASIGAHSLRRALAATRATNAADLVVAASPPLLGAAAATAIARRRKIPTIVLAYDLVTDLASDAFGAAGRIPGRVLQDLEGTMYANASAVIALSDEMAARIRVLCGRESAVIRIWADDELLDQDHAPASRAFRARLGIADSKRLIGFAGNFGKKQHLSELAAALRQLSDEYAVVFVGDGPERAALENLQNLQILPPLAPADLHAFLTACDLSIVMAWTEHAGSLFPSKVANILAAGSPIVAVTHAETELGRLITHEDLGIICSSLEPRAIRDAVQRGARAGRADGREARCRRVAREQFDRRQAMARFLAEVNSLLLD